MQLATAGFNELPLVRKKRCEAVAILPLRPYADF